MSTSKAVQAIVEKQLAQREVLWPGMSPCLWHRKANKGFGTIPKTMPLILQIMDGLSNGKPLSATYLGVWCETWDNSMANVSKHREMAHAAGFTGQRATYTWSARMHLLHQLRFIDIKPGKSGAISHAIIWNPHWVIRWHRLRKTPGLVEANFNALVDRALEIGAKDMIDDIPGLVPDAFPPSIAVTAPGPASLLAATPSSGPSAAPLTTVLA